VSDGVAGRGGAPAVAWSFGPSSRRLMALPRGRPGNGQGGRTVGVATARLVEGGPRARSCTQGHLRDSEHRADRDPPDFPPGISSCLLTASCYLWLPLPAVLLDESVMRFISRLRLIGLRHSGPSVDNDGKY
jgi:hypothetical protein